MINELLVTREKIILPPLHINPFVLNASFLYPLKTLSGGTERVHSERMG